MIRRTVVFQISPTEEQEKILRETIKLYSKAWSYCVGIAWDMGNLSKIDLHKSTYTVLKKNLKLKSQYLCSSRDRAIETVRAMRALQARRKKVSKPSEITSRTIPLRLDARTLSFDKERSVASVATQKSRMKIPLVWHRQARKYEAWFCKSGEIGINRTGKWVLRLIFEIEPQMLERSKNVFGADRGIRRPVVLSNNKFYGEHWWKEHERKLLSLISRLQSKGTKSARSHMKMVWRRLRRFREDCDRIIAKEIISSLLPGDTIVLEILTNIRERCGAKGKARKKHRAKVNRWSFKRLEEAIKYNAELNGIYVEQVDAHYTSQACSRCNVVCKKNRKTQSLYSCECGLRLNADLNAARNIANKWCIANGHTSGLPVDQPIVTDQYLYSSVTSL